VSEPKRQSFSSSGAGDRRKAALFSGKAIVRSSSPTVTASDATTLIALRMLFSGAFSSPSSTCGLPAGSTRCRGGDHLRLIVIGLLGYYAASYSVSSA